MKKVSRRLLSLLLAAVLLAAALPMAGPSASAAMVGSYFTSGNPPFAYVVTGLKPLDPGDTVKLYQNETMQSYASYTGEYTIPEQVFDSGDFHYYTVTEIGGARGETPGALENVPLQKIVLPGSVSIIGARAFAGCYSLREVHFPTSVTTLASDAFTGVDLGKLTLDVVSAAALSSSSAYTPQGKTAPVSLPRTVTDLLVRDVLTVSGQVEIPGAATLSSGRITVQSGAALTLAGELSGTGVIEVANNGELTLRGTAAAFSGSIRLSGAASRFSNSTSSPVTVVNAAGKAVPVQPGKTFTGGQEEEKPEQPEPGSLWPQITTNYGGTVQVQLEGKVIVILPYEGYVVKETVINGLSMGDITRYEFQTASSQNTVAVTFAQGEKEEGPEQPVIDPLFQFTDVPVTAPYASSLRFLVNNGVFQGMNNAKFAPDQLVNRAMLASLIKRLEVYGDRYVLKCKNPVYAPDVPSDCWYVEDAAWIAGTGVLLLKTDTVHNVMVFRPKENVTRMDVALVLYRYTRARGYDTVMTRSKLFAYSDLFSLPTEARHAMAWTMASGFLAPKNGKADPRGVVTRSEIADILAKYLQFFH